MTYEPLPEVWSDEPWPLDDPAPPPSFRPSNWSDTHDQPPQVADLADEAQQLVDRYGMSMERALVEAQREHGGLKLQIAAMGHMASRSVAAAVVPSMHAAIRAAIDQEQLDQARKAAEEFQDAWDLLTTVWSVTADDLADMVRTFGAPEQERRPQPSCPTHGVLAKGGFCRRCAARNHR